MSAHTSLLVITRWSRQDWSRLHIFAENGGDCRVFRGKKCGRAVNVQLPRAARIVRAGRAIEVHSSAIARRAMHSVLRLAVASLRHDDLKAFTLIRRSFGIIAGRFDLLANPWRKRNARLFSNLPFTDTGLWVCFWKMLELP